MAAIRFVGNSLCLEAPAVAFAVITKFMFFTLIPCCIAC